MDRGTLVEISGHAGYAEAVIQGVAQISGSKMIHDDRENIFASIRRNLRGAPKQNEELISHSPLNYVPDTAFEKKRGRFAREIAALGGVSRNCSSSADAVQFLKQNVLQGKRTFIYDAVRSEFPALVDEIERDLTVTTESQLPAGYAVGLAAQFDVAVTSCTACIAETGSFVLENATRLPASLATSLVVVARADRLLGTLDELFTEKFSRHGMSNMFIVTGPSRTADIEKELVKGVHGPKEVYVLFMKD